MINPGGACGLLRDPCQPNPTQRHESTPNATTACTTPTGSYRPSSYKPRFTNSVHTGGFVGSTSRPATAPTRNAQQPKARAGRRPPLPTTDPAFPSQNLRACSSASERSISSLPDTPRASSTTLGSSPSALYAVIHTVPSAALGATGTACSEVSSWRKPEMPELHTIEAIDFTLSLTQEPALAIPLPPIYAD